MQKDNIGLLSFRTLVTFLLLFLSFVSYGQEFANDEVIVKFRTGNGVEDLSAEFKKINRILAVEQLFPNAKPFELLQNGEINISTIYSIKIEPTEHLLKVIQRFNQIGLFEYAEPRHYGRLAYTPNDPGLANQYALKLVQAEKAWDIGKGSANVLIGVLDAGIDTAHPELKGRYFINAGDPVNGTDDDGDGYTDNYLGANTVNKSGDVLYSTEHHGVWMSGLIAPATDNGQGIAGAAFNCKMLGVKVTSGSNVTHGYEGIQYAADKGCKVINCSWNIKTYSKFGEDMVNYATINKGALVVAATGNQGKEDQNYPAMYMNALAVTNTDLNDNRVTNSNIGFYADVSAPGLNVITVKPKTGILRNSGTSFSCAMVSGAAGLLAATYPQLTPQELKYRIKAGSSPLYTNGKNEFYKNKLGAGRLDMHSAMTHSGSWIEMDSVLATDAEGGAIEQSDTVLVRSWFTNYLNASLSNRKVVLKTLSGYAVVLNDQWNIGTMNKGEQKDNVSQPFKVKIKSFVPQNEVIEFELLAIDNTDTTTFGFSIVVNPTYRDIDINDLKVTIGARGTFGFYEYPQKKGSGVTYKGSQQLLYEGGLLVGQKLGSEVTVVDRIRGIRDVEQTDFRTVQGLTEIKPKNSDLGFTSTFDDFTAKKRLYVGVRQQTRAWKASAHSGYVIIDYYIYPLPGKVLKDIYVGLQADWEIDNFEQNKAAYNGQRYLAYTYSDNANAVVAGTQLLSEYNDWKCYSIDHVNGGRGGIDLTDNDVFSKEEKFEALTNYREEAGAVGSGNDVMQVLSTGPHTVNEGDTLKVSFAIHVAGKLSELLEQADSAFFKENGELPNAIIDIVSNPEFSPYPNPSKGEITLPVHKTSDHEITVINAYGSEVDFGYVKQGNGIDVSLIHPEPGIYFIKSNGKTYRWLVVQ